MKMAWFWRGAQSAFFYYVSCAPCANYAFERRRAKQKARAEKEMKELMKHASRHYNGQLLIPDEVEGIDQERITGVGAFTTNIYWREDILLGPQPKKGRNRANTIERFETGNRNERKKQRKPGKGPQLADARTRRCTTAGSLESARTSSLDTIRPGPSRDGIPDQDHSVPPLLEDLNIPDRSRYQRPDELLWGKPSIEKDWEYYARGRNPDVNSLCPPVVSTKPANPDQARWMLQPPPPAKVMDGRHAPLARRSSAKLLEKHPLTSKRSGGTSFNEFIHKPERVYICELGERMTDLFEPIRPKINSDSHYIVNQDGSDIEYRSATPSGQHRSQSDQVSSIHQNGSQRARSRSKGSTAMQNSSRVASPSRNRDQKSQVLDQRYHFDQTPREEAMQRSYLNNIPATIPRIDGYHSEPEPSSMTGVAFQDFANSNQLYTNFESSRSASRPNFHSPESQPRSHSNSSGSHSVQSSSSSLRPLEELMTSSNRVQLPEAVSMKKGQLDSLNSGMSTVNASVPSLNDVEYWREGSALRFENSSPA